MNREQIVGKLAELNTELKALLEKQGLSAEESARLESITDEMEKLRGDLEDLKAEEDRQASIRERANALSTWVNTPARTVPHSTSLAPVNNPGVSAVQAAPTDGLRQFSVPARAYRNGVTSFKDRDGFSKEQRAFAFGQWFLATCCRMSAAQRWCREHGLELAGMTAGGDVINFGHNEVVNVAGGFLVPAPLETDLIDLREQYGVFRQYARVRPMTSDTLAIPRRTGGLTAYFVSDEVAITESTKGWDRVNLTAKKLGALAKYSSELGEDAIISVANDLAQEIAYAFANKEDECGFNGDGTSTYGGIVGVRSAFTNLSGTIANIAGLVVGTGNLYSELTLTDFESVVGKLPQYADTPNARWFVHRTFYWTVMIRLMLASGGVTEAEVSRQGRNVPFLGYPAVFSQVMPSVEANSQVCAIFGDLSLGAAFGDRRMTTIAMSEHLNFAEDQIAVRGTERFDIVVHDVGNAHATAASRVPGPIVGLITAAS